MVHLTRGEREVIGRRVRVDLTGPRAVSVLITRSCIGVECPAASDAPELTACLAGRCVAPECTEDQPENCPASECRDTTDCAASGAGCARPLCTESGVCFLAPDHTACPDNEVCNIDQGCLGVSLESDHPTLRFPWNGFRTGHVAAAPRSGGAIALRWEPLLTASRYEVQISDAPIFAVPEVIASIAAPEFVPPGSALSISTAPPVGTRHYWRVRGCDDATCSLFHHRESGGGARFGAAVGGGDIDGDGLSDLVIGAPQDTNGWLAVYHGRRDLHAFTESAPHIARRTEATRSLGETIAVGDMTGDRRAEIAAGGPAFSGEIVVRWTHDPTSVLRVEGSIVRGLTARGLGAALNARDDVDGDGFRDLIVTTVTEVCDGSLSIYRGNPGLAFGETLTDGLLDPEGVSGFGAALP